jgi:streptogramin lyase
MTFPLLPLKNIITFLFSRFNLYNLLNIQNHLSQETSIIQMPIQNIQGQLQQPQTDYIKYEYQSDYIKEFEISQIVNETGLKGITIDSKNNAWFFHNTNTSSAIIEFNPVNNTFIKYPITKKTNVDNAIMQ